MYRLRSEHPIGMDTPVFVRRTVKSLGEANEHGPLPLREALLQGLNSTSSGTVSVSIWVAEEGVRGADVHFTGSKWVATTYMEMDI